MRGWKAFRETSRELREIRMRNCFDYFERLRSRLLHNAGLVISYYYLKYKVRLPPRARTHLRLQERKAKREQERMRLLQQKLPTIKKPRVMRLNPSNESVARPGKKDSLSLIHI